MLHKITVGKDEIPQVVAEEMSIVLFYLIKQAGGEIKFPTNIKGLKDLLDVENFTLVKKTNRDEFNKVIDFTLKITPKVTTCRMKV